MFIGFCNIYVTSLYYITFMEIVFSMTRKSFKEVKRVIESKSEAELIRCFWDGFDFLENETLEYLLFFASMRGNDLAVRTLIQVDADINQANNHGVTPLWMASYNGHVGVVEALLANGADVNEAVKEGSTSLYIASQNGHVDVVERLLAAEGIDVNQARNGGATPLLMASQNGHVGVVERLLAAEGIDVNKATKDGATPLYKASENGNVGVVERLLANGARVNQADINGVAPLYIASQNNHADVIKVLSLAYLVKGIKIPETIVTEFPSMVLNFQYAKDTFEHIKDPSNTEPIYIALRHWIDNKGVIEDMSPEMLKVIFKHLEAGAKEHEAAVQACLDIISKDRVRSAIVQTSRDNASISAFICALLEVNADHFNGIDYGRGFYGCSETIRKVCSGSGEEQQGRDAGDNGQASGDADSEKVGVSAEVLGQLTKAKLGSAEKMLMNQGIL